MDNLSLHKSRSHYPHHLFSWKDTEAPIEQINNNRDQFIVNLKLGLLALMQDRVSHQENSNERLTPQDWKKSIALALLAKPKRQRRRASRRRRLGGSLRGVLGSVVWIEG
jgi:hypothetical protein